MYPALPSALTADDRAWLTLALIEGIGGARLKALAAHFSQRLGDIFAATPADLRAVSGIGPRLADAIAAADRARTDAQLAAWAAHGVHAVPLIHPAYPALLHTLPDPPAALFIRAAAWPLEQNPALLARTAAIVGTRSPSETARTAALAAAAALAAEDVVVISGLALGIDRAAHEGALTAGGGFRTVAVLGGGVLRVFPPEHRALAEAVAAGGALICECAPNAHTTTPGLVARNRIIAGLAGAVLVAETSADGGAMHAARRAAALARRIGVFAPVGEGDAVSGSLTLMRDGAAVLEPARAGEPGYAAAQLGL